MTSRRDIGSTTNNSAIKTTGLMLDKLEWSDRSFMTLTRAEGRLTPKSSVIPFPVNLKGYLHDSTAYFRTAGGGPNRFSLAVGGTKFASTNGKRVFCALSGQPYESRSVKSEFGESVDNVLSDEQLAGLDDLIGDHYEEPYQFQLEKWAQIMAAIDSEFTKQFDFPMEAQRVVRTVEIYFDFWLYRHTENEVLAILNKILRNAFGCPHIDRRIQDEMGKSKATAIAMWLVDPSLISTSYKKTKAKKYKFEIKLYRKGDRYRFEIAGHHPRSEERLKDTDVTRSSLVQQVQREAMVIADAVALVKDKLIAEVSAKPEGEAENQSRRQALFHKALAKVRSRLHLDTRAGELINRLVGNQYIELSECRDLGFENQIKRLRKIGLLGSVGKGLTNSGVGAKSKLIRVDWLEIDRILSPSYVPKLTLKPNRVNRKAPGAYSLKLRSTSVRSNLVQLHLERARQITSVIDKSIFTSCGP